MPAIPHFSSFSELSPEIPTAPTVGLAENENVGDTALVDLQDGARHEELSGMDMVDHGASPQSRAGDHIGGSEFVGDGVHERDYHAYARRTNLSTKASV